MRYRVHNDEHVGAVWFGGEARHLALGAGGSAEARRRASYPSSDTRAFRRFGLASRLSSVTPQGGGITCRAKGWSNVTAAETHPLHWLKSVPSGCPRSQIVYAVRRVHPGHRRCAGWATCCP